MKTSVVDKAQWARVESLFEKAIQIPNSKRDAFLIDQCGDNPKLLDEVQSLVASHENIESPDVAASFTQGIAGEFKQLADQIKRQTTRSITPNQSHLASKPARSVRDLREELERRHPDFEVIEVISQGGTGAVFRVNQISLSRDVAVKVLLTTELDDRIRKRFIRESKATAKVKHNNVVDIYSVHDDSDLPFLVMEFVDGPSLKSFVESKGQIDSRLAANIALQIADGLHAAHQQELVHRDVKPANVILESSEVDETELSQPRAKLIDFGIVRDLASDGATLDQLIVGTPSFMSPEQLFSPQEVDHRCDVYGLGITLYFMLTGTLPFHGAPHMIMRQVDTADPTPPRKLDDRIPKDLESICLKAIHKLPAKRYATADEMKQDLNRFLSGQPTIARPIKTIEKVFRWSHRNKKLSFVMALAGMLAIALISGSLLFALTVASKDREITKRRSETVESRVQAIIDAQPEALPNAIETLGELSPTIQARLSKVIEADTIRLSSKVNAAITLGMQGTPQSEFIVASIDDLIESPHVCQNLAKALQQDPQAFDALKKSLESLPDANQKAKRIILLAALGDFSEWVRAAENLIDPTTRTATTQIYGHWHADPVDLADKLVAAKNERWSWTLCAALLRIDSRTLNDQTIKKVVERLKEASDTRHYTTFRFAQLAIRQLAPSSIKQLSWDHPDVRNFDNGIHMVRIRPEATELGKFDKAKINTDHPPRKVTLTRGYFLADSEITVEQYAEFAAETEGLPNGEAWIKLEKFNRTASPTNGHPINQVSWFEAVQFCNWLSKKNGLKPAYHKIEPALVFNDENGQQQEMERWRVDIEANGFRLPTDAEWEFASRNNSRTVFHFGSDRTHMADYGHGSSARFIPTVPVHDLYPNSFGLHGMLGNIWEWTNNRYDQNEKSTPLVDPLGPKEYVNGNYDRVFQGGGIDSAAGGLDSEVRGNTSPAKKFYNLGFRICMTDAEQ